MKREKGCIEIKDVNMFNYQEIIQNINKTIIWIGAGISIPEPSCIPSGYNLTKFYLDYTMPYGQAKKIMDRWKSISDISSNIFLSNSIKYSQLMRLEFVIGCIDDVDYEIKGDRLISGFSKFANILPNENHKIIKSIMYKYKPIIITPNFDCCIENSFEKYAYTSKMGVGCSDILKEYNIYHYHGSGYSYEQLGATIRMLKRGFSKDFSEYIYKLLKDGYNIIFLGFSCSDYFDVTQFFKSLKWENFEGYLYYINHSPTDEVYVKNKLQAIFKCFYRKIIINGDTNIFLKKVCGEDSISIDRKSIVKWDSEFKKIKIPNFIKNLYLIKVLNRSGLGIDVPWEQYNMIKYQIIDMYKKYNIIKHLEENYPDNKEQSIIYDIISIFNINSSSEIYNSYFSSRQINNSIKKSFYMDKSYTIKTIYKNIDRNSLSHAELFALIRHMKESTYTYIKTNGNNKNDIIKLNKVSCKLLNLSPCDFPYISYYTAISRAHEILNIIAGNCSEYMVNLAYSAEIAIEICATFELYKIVETLAIINIIEYFQTKKCYFLKNAINIYYELKKIKDKSRHPDIVNRYNNKNYIFNSLHNEHSIKQYAEEILLSLLKN